MKRFPLYALALIGFMAVVPVRAQPLPPDGGMYGDGVFPTYGISEPPAYVEEQDPPAYCIPGLACVRSGKAAIGVGLVGLAAAIFWLMMIVHAARHAVPNRALWILAMIFTGILGAVAYWIFVKRTYALPAPMPATPQPETPHQP